MNWKVDILSTMWIQPSDQYWQLLPLNYWSQNKLTKGHVCWLCSVGSFFQKYWRKRESCAQIWHGEMTRNVGVTASATNLSYQHISVFHIIGLWLTERRQKCEKSLKNMCMLSQVFLIVPVLEKRWDYVYILYRFLKSLR